MAHTTGTTTPDLTSVLTTWLNKNFVSDLEWMLQYQRVTEKAVIPAGSGNIGRFLTFNAPTKYKSYSGDGGGDGSTAITEGSTTANEITGITQTSTNITIGEFGEFTKIGTLYEYASVSGLRAKLLKRLRDGAAFSLDRFTLKKALLTTTTRIATAGTAGSTAYTAALLQTSLGAAAIMSTRRVLVENLAQGFEGEAGIPNGQYACIVTPGQEQDIITESTTTRTTWQYGNVNVPGPMGQEKFVKGYLGSIYQVAMFVTQNYTTLTNSGSGADVGIMFADGGVGAMAFQNMNAEIIVNDVNSPYKNMNSIAWHANFGAGLIDANRVIKLYSLSS